MTRTVLLATALLVLSACSWQQNTSGPSVALTFVSPPYTFALPSEMVDGARVLSTEDGGLAIVLGKTYIAIDTITGDEIGYPDLDMRSYPSAIWGETQSSGYPPELQAEISRIQRFYADNHPNMEKPVILNQGTIWLAYGGKETVTLMTHKHYPDILVRLYTRRVPVEVVREKIIGAISGVAAK